MAQTTLFCKTCVDLDPEAAIEESPARLALTFPSSGAYLQHRADEHDDCVVCGAPKKDGKYVCLHEQIERRPKKLRLEIAKGIRDSAGRLIVKTTKKVTKKTTTKKVTKKTTTKKVAKKAGLGAGTKTAKKVPTTK